MDEILEILKKTVERQQNLIKLMQREDLTCIDSVRRVRDHAEAFLELEAQRQVLTTALARICTKDIV